MNLRRAARELYFKWFSTPLDREIWYVSRSAAKLRSEAHAMAVAFLEGEHLCCVHCYTGGEYGRVLDKIERVEIQLGRLLKRKSQRKQA